MRFEFLKDYKNHTKGDIVQLRQDFWSRYYTVKGIIQPYEQLQIQDPKPIKKTTTKRKNGVKK